MLFHEISKGEKFILFPCFQNKFKHQNVEFQMIPTSEFKNYLFLIPTAILHKKNCLFQIFSILKSVRDLFQFFLLSFLISHKILSFDTNMKYPKNHLIMK